ncbi:MAG: right-handed parallel beta-helix repeat-containing protein, partial [Chloroflexota bacterium]
MMFKHVRFVLLSAALLLALLVTMASPVTVHADDGTPPPPPTEEPVLPPVEEPVVVEEPAATEEPATPEPVTESPEETVTLPEVLEQLPEDTAVVIVVDGQVEPLATQDAAEAIVTGDPIWCPEEVTPQAGVGGCTDPGVENANYDPTSLTSLLAYLDANEIAQAGVIWIESDYDSSVNDSVPLGITIDGNTFTTMRNYALTIQGGWSGGNNTDVDHENPSVFFHDYLYIENWQANVTVNDIEISDSNGDYGLWVRTTGDITVSNVSAHDNDWQGAFLDNHDGTGGITVQQSTFNDNGVEEGGSGLRAASTGSIILSQVTANGNTTGGAYLINDYAGATGNINISDSIFGEVENGNGDTGLGAYSNGNITLSQVTATWNGDEGAALDNCNLNDVTDECDGVGSITVDQNSTFNDNYFEGLEADSNGSIVLSNVFAYRNGSAGADLDNGDGTGGITIGQSTFSDNGQEGLGAYSNGSITLSQVTANGNANTGLMAYSYGGDITLGDVTANNNNTSGHGDVGGAYLEAAGSVEVTQGTFNTNRSGGLYALAWLDWVTLDHVVASENYGVDMPFGAYIDSFGDYIAVTNSTFNDNQDYIGLAAFAWEGNITLNNVTANGNFFGAGLEAADNVAVTQGTFNNNNWAGLYASSDSGDVTLDHVIASGNDGEGAPGAELDAAGNATVICSQFNNNAGYGVDGDSVDGVFTLNDVTFSGNSLGNYSGSPIITSGDCNPVTPAPATSSDQTEDKSFAGLPLHIIPITGSLDCKFYSGTMLILPNGDRAVFPCPLEDEGRLDVVSDGSLPGSLPDGMGFVSS